MYMSSRNLQTFVSVGRKANRVFTIYGSLCEKPVTNMSTSIHFGQGKQKFIRGVLLVVLIVALFAIMNYAIRNSATNADVIEDIVKRMDMGMSGGNSDDDLDDESWDRGNAYNPCYEVGSQMFCGPAVYLMGIQYAGLNILKKAIGLHPDVDCYASGFFSNFTDMIDIGHSDLVTYFRSFEESTQKIQNGSNKLCICDSGSDLARPYKINFTDGVIFPPKYTTAAALKKLHSDMKVVVILRDPTVRFIREYCALGMAQPFEDVVDDAIAGFENCEKDVFCVNASCVYDKRLSGLLQAGLYDYLIEEDLDGSFVLDSYHLMAWDQLENPKTRNATMTGIFKFIGKDIPHPKDPYWAALDALFIFPQSDCNGQTIPTAAKQKLRDFYSTRATIYDLVN